MSGCVAPPSAVRSWTVACHCRLCWVAPTDVIHGTSAGEPTVSGPGPELPAEVATSMPAARALRNARPSGSLHGADAAELPIE